MMAIAGRTAVVTGVAGTATGPGGLGGLGAEVARQLHQRGAHLVLSGRRRRPLDAVAAALEGATTTVCDLGHAEQRRQLAERAATADILVLVTEGGPARTVGVDLGPVLLARAVAPAMAERGGGRIVFATAGPDTRRGRPTAGLAVRGLAAALRQDLAGTGVGVSVVVPGPAARGAAASRLAGWPAPDLVGVMARGVVRAVEGPPADVLARTGDRTGWEAA